MELNVNQAETLDITKLSIIELKALAYDEMLKLDLSQNNLRILNSEIARRMSVSETKGKDSHLQSKS